jgi:hypothetical protein
MRTQDVNLFVATLRLEISCDCGTKHIVPLDMSGHYDGPRPCDNVDIRVQVDPQSWREIMKNRSDAMRH